MALPWIFVSAYDANNGLPCMTLFLGRYDQSTHCREGTNSRNKWKAPTMSYLENCWVYLVYRMVRGYLEGKKLTKITTSLKPSSLRWIHPLFAGSWKVEEHSFQAVWFMWTSSRQFSWTLLLLAHLSVFYFFHAVWQVWEYSGILYGLCLSQVVWLLEVPSRKVDFSISYSSHYCWHMLGGRRPVNLVSFTGFLKSVNCLLSNLKNLSLE